MKAVLLFTLLVGSALAAPSVDIKNSRVFEDLITSILECIRGIGITGLPEYDVPSFDPLELAELEVDLGIIHSDGISGSLQVTDLTFSGIVEFVIQSVSGTIHIIPPSYTIQVSLLVPNPALTTNYVFDLTSENLDYELDGEGTLSFNCNDFTIDVSFRLTILGGIGVDQISAPIAVASCSEFEITGVRGDDELSAIISQQGQENAALWVSLASPRFEELLTDAVNAAFDSDVSGEAIGVITERCL